MSCKCEKCGLCDADADTLGNLTTDLRSRGNFEIATSLQRALERCGVLREKLDTDNREYLKNVSRMVKEDASSDVSSALLKDAKNVVKMAKGKDQTTVRGMGFANMLEASRSSSHSKRHEDNVQRDLDDRESSTPIRRGMGFANMLEASRRGTLGIQENFKRDLDSVRPIPSGFRAMLETMFPNRTPEALHKKPRVLRGMGFAAMLEGASRGTEI